MRIKSDFAHGKAVLWRRARMRKPSCFSSCSQPAPLGGALAGESRHGSINPSLGRVPRNEMRSS